MIASRVVLPRPAPPFHVIPAEAGTQATPGRGAVDVILLPPLGFDRRRPGIEVHWVPASAGMTLSKWAPQRDSHGKKEVGQFNDDVASE